MRARRTKAPDSKSARARAPRGARRHKSLHKPAALRRFAKGFRWEGVTLEPYKLEGGRAGEFRAATRQVLVGNSGEQAAFHLRYFELAPGGFTSYERHRHCHVVIGVRGRGMVRIGAQRQLLRPMDIAYIGPGEAHQLSAAGHSPFGFFCIVNARRDRPRPAL